MARGCLYCSALALAGTTRCARHTLASGWAAYKPAHSSVYKSAAWAELRAQVLREQPICAVDGCRERSNSVRTSLASPKVALPTTAPTCEESATAITVNARVSRVASQAGEAQEAVTL